ncbi:MAG: carboxymuconolactone decarboxylase family protein [bacterium]
MTTEYPDRNKRVHKLMGELRAQLPDTMAAYSNLQQAATRKGALDTKTKELIALAIGITLRCDGCITFHIYDAMRSGATREEILDTIGVAVMMGGGPSVVYGAEAMEALNQFEMEASLESTASLQ